MKTLNEVDIKLDVAFEKLITSGGDERNILLENGLNRYYVNPIEDRFAFNRGSCTCNILNPDVLSKVYELYQNVSSGDLPFAEARSSQVKRLKKLMENSEDAVDFDIFFAPSGSDLCYYPILFSALTHPNKPIMSIVTCSDELGTGSILSNRALFHAEQTQVLSSVKKGSSLNPDIQIEYVPFSARDENGNILDHKDKIRELIIKNHQEYNIIANFVIGSKSGIEDNLDIIEEMNDFNVMWVVDLCQLRVTPKLAKSLLNLNCFLMVTGSKFFQGPPFSGALLSPSTYTKGLMDKNGSLGFEQIFTMYDFPVQLNLRNSFPDYQNLGLLLRWEAAILEMENLAPLEEKRINYVVTKWNRVVTERIENSPYLELLQDYSKTNISIVSFKVKDTDGQYFAPDKLKKLHKSLTLQTHEFPSGATKAIIGQTVERGKDSFLRLALGSFNVRHLLLNDMDLSDDMYVLDRLEQLIEKGVE